MSFTLNRWELDNLSRGARDIDLGPLEAAAAKIADFEEQAIYSGYSSGGIVGMQKAASNKPVPFGKDSFVHHGRSDQGSDHSSETEC